MLLRSGAGKRPTIKERGRRVQCLVRRTNTDYEQRLTCSIDTFLLSPDPSQRIGGPPTQHIPQPSLPPEVPFPFIFEIPAGSKALGKERKSMPHPLILLLVLMPVVKEQQRNAFRTWSGSPNIFRQEAELVDYKARIIHLTSSNGVPLEIPESEPSKGDIGLLDVCGKAHYKVITRTFIPWLSLRLLVTAAPPRIVPYLPRSLSPIRTLVTRAEHHPTVFRCFCDSHRSTGTVGGGPYGFPSRV